MARERAKDRERDPDYVAKRQRYRDAERMFRDLTRKADTCWAIIRALNKASKNFNIDVRAGVQQLVGPYLKFLTDEIEEVRRNADYNPSGPDAKLIREVEEVHGEHEEIDEFTVNSTGPRKKAAAARA